jgi:hypothetical protein
MNMKDFKVDLDSRGPIEWVALVLTIVVLLFALVFSVPWWFTLFPGLVTLSIIMAMIRNTKRGLLLTQTTLSMYQGTWKQQIQLTDVCSLTITEWSDSTDAELLMRDGKTISIRSCCYARSQDLANAFRARGIKVIEK